ncbi:MAG: type IV conjugative transfer system protein TraL [Sphingobacteriia bacterium]|jgi:conjugal transfer pilus assembly protein TraL|nr:type IV conjugative transfer system protein TraL [Sphingobacteriia bacterium]
MDLVPIPRYVDSQMQILFWEIDEVVPVVALMGVGIMTDTMGYMIFVMVIVWKLFGKFKNRNLDGVLMHMAYAGGLSNLNKRFPPGVERVYVS